MDRRIRLVATAGRACFDASKTSSRRAPASLLAYSQTSSLPEGRRTYATPRPSPTARRAQRQSAAQAQQGKQPGGPDAVLDQLDKKTSVGKKIWDEAEAAFKQGVTMFDSEIPPDECVAAAMLYVTVRKLHPQTRWQVYEQEHNLSPYRLHLVGIMLFQGASSVALKFLGFSMLQTALSSGYLPTALSMLSLLGEQKERLQGQALDMHREAKNVLRAHLQSRRGTEADADALTMAGMLAERDRDSRAALAFYQQAIKTHGSLKLENERAGTDTESSGDAGTETPQRKLRWEWEGECLMGLWRLSSKAGKHQEAMSALRVAALELNLPEAHLALAKTMKEQDAQREEHILAAARYALPEACRMMSELEDRRADATTDDSSAAQEHRLLAREWHLLGMEAETPAVPLAPGSGI